MLPIQHELGGILERAVLANSDHRAYHDFPHDHRKQSPSKSSSRTSGGFQVIPAHIIPADFRTAGSSFLRLEQ